jgi:hypothetical protein
MEKSTILACLALGTLLVGMAIAAYQIWSVKDAKLSGSHIDGSRDA